MIRGFISWLEIAANKYEISIIPISKQESWFDPSIVLPTFIGGMANFGAAFLTFRLTSLSDTKRRIQQSRDQSAIKALVGYHKISRWVDIVGSIEMHINYAYHLARVNGLDATDAYQIVGPIAGIFSPPDPLSVEELHFLYSKETANLINEIALLGSRLINFRARRERLLRGRWPRGRRWDTCRILSQPAASL